jgi:hypothetical protein
LLLYSSVTFYCEVYSYNKQDIIGVLQQVIVNSESEADVTISYVGESNFRYDSNGDTTIESSERERTL